LESSPRRRLFRLGFRLGSSLSLLLSLMLAFILVGEGPSSSSKDSRDTWEASKVRVAVSDTYCADVCASQGSFWDIVLGLAAHTAERERERERESKIYFKVPTFLLGNTPF